MRDTTFDELYSKISKIVDLVAKVPAAKQTEVFDLLYDALGETIEDERTYKDEIMKLTDNGEALKAFIEEKRPVSNIERTTYFVHFLNRAGIELVNAQQLAYCYEICNLDQPGNLNQNMRDASSKKYGYIENVQNKMRTSAKGREFCEN